MSVSSFDPNQISVTDPAMAHIQAQIARSGHRYLRLGIKESGCNGYMYMLDFLEEPESDDQCFDFGDDVRVCVREADLDLVAGTEVDMITEGLNSALVFKNPRAVSYCGCGESFAVDPGQGGGNAVDVGDLATDVGRH